MPAIRPSTELCHVLIVDDDAASAEQYAEIATSLGYECATAADAREALRLIAEDKRIGLVVTDVNMPALDGISFLDELSARYSRAQPIVALVITGFGSLELAVDAMRLDAADFLTKPITYQAFSQALRRALRKWTKLTGQLAEDSTLTWFPAADDGYPILTDRPFPADASPRTGGSDTGEPTEEELASFLQGYIRTHERRGMFLDTDLFADPAWSILLDLALARLDNKPLPVSSACVAAGVPMSTALRHIRILVANGYARRWQDPKDRRRDLLMIEDPAMKGVTNYMTTLWKRANETLTK
jgi:CheY-like chemotaxis protein